MSSKYFVVIFSLLVGAVCISHAVDELKSTYLQIILQEYYSQTPTAQNEPWITFLHSDIFGQLSQAMDYGNLLQNAVVYHSNATDILTAFRNSDIIHSGTVNLENLMNVVQLEFFFENFVNANNLTFPANVGSASNLEVSTHCLVRSIEVFIGLGTGQKWALQMLDATAKFPTDILNMNLDWWGSFDGCVAVKPPQYEIDFKGQYCTVAIPVPLHAAPGINPNIEIGMCVPDPCSGNDLLKIINFAHALASPRNKTLSNVGSVTCQINDVPYDGKAIAVLSICGVIILLMTFATIYDVTIILWWSLKKSNNDLTHSNKKEKVIDKDEKEERNGIPEKNFISVIEIGVQKQHTFPEKDGSIRIISDGSADGESNHKINGHYKFPVKQPVHEATSYKPGSLGKLLLSFSVYTNGKKLLNTKQSSGTLTAVNGIRFLSMCWIILGHTVALGNINIRNIRVYLPLLYTRTSFQMIPSAVVAVDSFFAMSGLLLTYVIFKDMKRTKKSEGSWFKFWFMFYFHRFWRLTPPYMLILGLYVTMTPHFYNGPQYPQGGFYLDQYCSEQWWTNLLYVNNIVNARKMCMEWTWYLANDMQFYVISPIMLLPLFFFPVAGVIVPIVFLLATSVTTGVLAKVNQWASHTTMVGANPPSDMLYDYYIKPYCRMGPFIIGVLTGYILYKTRCKVKVNRYLNIFIWAVAIVLACLVVYALYEPQNGNPMSDEVSALFLATHRTVWGACVCWVIFACATGNGGFVNTFLSWKAFVPLARLTYCSYLIHPIIIALYSGGVRVQQYWTDIQLAYLFVGHLVFSYAGAFIISLSIEAPMLGLEKFIFNRRNVKTS